MIQSTAIKAATSWWCHLSR